MKIENANHDRRRSRRRWPAGAAVGAALVLVAGLAMEASRALGAAASGPLGPPGEPPTVAHLELARYEGRWLTVATSRRAVFQRICRDRTEARYTLASDARGPLVEVRNSCRTLAGVTYTVSTTARIADRPGNAVSYVPDFGGTNERPDSFVVGLGEPGRFGAAPAAYSWAIVSDRDRTNVWIMVRDPSHATAALREAATAAERAELDLSDLYLEPQPGADFLDRGGARDVTVRDYLGRTR